jgi:hypothetical protein
VRIVQIAANPIEEFPDRGNGIRELFSANGDRLPGNFLQCISVVVGAAAESRRVIVNNRLPSRVWRRIGMQQRWSNSFNGNKETVSGFEIFLKRAELPFQFVERAKLDLKFPTIGTLRAF